MQTEHLVDDTSIADEQAAQVRRTAGATETKLSQTGHDAPATPPPSATDGTSFGVVYERDLAAQVEKYLTVDEKCAFLDGVRFEVKWRYQPPNR
jgi:hypothetical protein